MNEDTAIQTGARTGKIMILGIGGNGAKIIRAFRKLPGSAACTTAAIDTDKEALNLSGAQAVIQAEADWIMKSGLGCGGDTLKGERAIARERSAITQLLTGCASMIVCGGLGGGTATGGVRTIASVARSLSIPALFLLTTPFSFESYTKRKKAEDCLNELLPVTEALAPLPNDLLFATLPPDTPAEEAFAKASEEMAAAVFGMSEILRSRSLIGSDFAQFAAVLQKRKASCAIGIGRASSEDGLDRCGLALEAMLESPFLGGAARLENANAVILTLTGGPSLHIDEMKRAIENAAAVLPQGAELIIGTSINPDYGSQLQITALAVRYEQTAESIGSNEIPAQDTFWKAEPEHSGRRRRRQPRTEGNMIQETFQLESFSRGIFAKSPICKYNNEDLDIPPFQRHRISIDKGSMGK